MIEKEKNNNLNFSLHQYGEELEAINQSFKLSLSLTKLQFSEYEKSLIIFAKKYGNNIEENKKEIHFSIPIERLADYKKLDRRLRSLKSSIKLVPRNFFVALICSYDAFLGKLLNFILANVPDILETSEKSLKYSQLLDFGSIELAKEYLIEKEIESVLRKSHIEHFKWLESKLNIPFNRGLENWPEFVELTERRNLFVHADGVVSSQYLNACQNHKCNVSDDVKVGVKLEVTESYFKSAYECLYEIGIKLAQVIWRKLKENDLAAIDQNLADTTYSLIENREYTIAIKVLEFFTEQQIAHHTEAIKRTLLINLAQSYKWLGENDKCQHLLKDNDWTASEDRFKLAVAVLKEDWGNAYVIMKKVAYDQDFNKSYYKDWPLFKDLRKQPEFLNIYRNCYNTEFPTRQDISSKLGAESEDGKDVPSF